MTTKPPPPEGLDGWMDWCLKTRIAPRGEGAHVVTWALAELAALRSRVAEADDLETALKAARRVMEWERSGLAARVAELEREMEKEVELRMHSLRIGLEAARREAKKIADLEQQVAALADALEHAVHRNHAPSGGCDGCVGIEAALRAAGRKT